MQLLRLVSQSEKQDDFIFAGEKLFKFLLWHLQQQTQITSILLVVVEQVDITTLMICRFLKQTIYIMQQQRTYKRISV